MSSLRKVFLNKKVVFITTRTVEGLPFTAALFMVSILESILARAQAQYPVKIFSFIFMANHLHLGVVVTDPELIPKFMQYVKSESAAAVNRLRGRSKRKVWDDGYDSPTILDATKAIEMIVYTYTNPAEANLVDSIAEYPGVSSWSTFSDPTRTSKLCPWIRRIRIPKLPKSSLTLTEQEKFNRELIDSAVVKLPLTVEPNCWIECFSELAGRSIEEINKEIVARIEEKENEFRAKRKKAVRGARKLRLDSIQRSYLPTKRGRRTWCLSVSAELRHDFITWVKALVAEAEAAYRSWCTGIFEQPFPPGLFPPSQPRRANLLTR